MGVSNFLAKIAGKLIAKKIKLEDVKMDNTKKWYQSKSVWTGVITFLIGSYEAAKPFASQFGKTLPDIPPIAFTFLGALGVYARVSADKKIG